MDTGWRQELIIPYFDAIQGACVSTGFSSWLRRNNFPILPSLVEMKPPPECCKHIDANQFSSLISSLHLLRTL